ncbi:MAG: 4a-hydroxytetrahydrobiopterin dehydratase [Fimbriimonas ginsengisoli]|uniref:Putative pterin-4-alpha-carbinolamine dehydratase n=1 Tax=Fimbriimonas ginsengisoli TaxID=1005039 RepID=A0A931PVG6_FIMGI|nr:4a-hydroxytetrahydrobiopterin dehydratase [Fimbriimonas ginsengisoli]
MRTLEHVKLSDEEIEQDLAHVPGWTLVEGQLTKTFDFTDYLLGVDFALKVGREAEDLDHHPDIHITWRKVKVAVNTHSVGGISPFDFELAKRVDKLHD